MRDGATDTTATSPPRSSGGIANLRVALVHDWLVTYAGAERVLEQLLVMFPDADVYTLLDLLKPQDRGFLNGANVHTSFIQRIPLLHRRHRAMLPLMPLAVEQFDMSAYDIVISSSHAVAKGVLTGPGQLHISYCHSPMRYAWDLQHQYLREADIRGAKGWLARFFLHRLRLWDVRTANGVDAFVANSRFIAKRLRKTYRRSSRVIHPPVDVDAFALRTDKEDFFLAASRLVPYKRMPLIVEAFSAMPDRHLVVVGDGPEMDRVRAAAGRNVEVVGWKSSNALRDLMQRARAFVFAAEEDFGITPVEAQACGTPVIAYGGGGVAETVIDGDTGVFFQRQSVPDLIDAVNRFDRADLLGPDAIRHNAERFGADVFRERMAKFVSKAWDRHVGQPVAARRRRRRMSSAA
jgi:O-antigen biosynthesis alpha-1,3-mannosyltransferase